MKKRIAIVCPYPKGKAPSQRFRYEHYLESLGDFGIEFKIFPFFDDRAWEYIYRNGFLFLKVISVLKGFFKRFLLMFALRKYDMVFIHREASPIGPPIFEWIIAFLLRKEIVFDFDDAIHLEDDNAQAGLKSFIKFSKKIPDVVKWSHRVSAGNDYLAKWAEAYNTDVTIIPTVVDTELTHNRFKNHRGDGLVVGWTGSHSTLVYLDKLIPIIQSLQTEIDFVFMVIANKDPKLPLKNYRFVKWKKESEIHDLLSLNIGVMPLENTQWAKGKCGFKAIQYMALGIPAVVSNVGVNSKIVDNGVNGYVVEKCEEWEKSLKALLIDEKLRTEFGAKARQKIINDYSVKSTTEQFVSLFL